MQVLVNKTINEITSLPSFTIRLRGHEYYLNIAEAVSRGSSCIRRQYGAVIVNNDEIISTGYNGGPRGDINCTDERRCWREENNIPHGERYEACVSVHAEMNALISASRKETIGSTLYLVGFGEYGLLDDTKSCDICRRLIINAGIKQVVTWDEFGEVKTTLVV